MDSAIPVVYSAAEELAQLDQMFGRVGYRLIGRRSLRSTSGRVYEGIKVVMGPNHDAREVWFDVTPWSGLAPAGQAESSGMAGVWMPALVLAAVLGLLYWTRDKR